MKETQNKQRGNLLYTTEQIQMYKNNIGNYEKERNTFLQTLLQIRSEKNKKKRNAKAR